MLHKWSFLLFICALLTFSQGNNQKKRDRNRLRHEKVNTFKERLHKKLEDLNNLKRALMEGKRKLVPSISSRWVKTDRTVTVRNGCTVQVDGSGIPFVVTSKNVMSILQNGSLIPIDSIPSYQALISLEAVEIGSAAWLIAQYTGRNGQHFVKTYVFKFTTLTRKQIIYLNSPSFVSATKFGNSMHVATATKNEFPEFRLYHLEGTRFVEIFRTPTEIACSGLAIWNINGIIYVALSFTDIGRLHIKQFLDHSGELLQIQFIDVHAYVMKSFDDGDNHYLICGTGDSIIIYWWADYSFRPVHSKLFRKKITDIAVLKFSGRLVIAVAFSHEVKFLVQDSSAQYVTAGSQSFSPSETLRSILFWKSDASLYMLPLFAENHPLSIYEIQLGYEISEHEREHSFEDCLNLLEGYLVKRGENLNKISSIVKNTWSSSSAFRISSVKVKGTVKSLRNSTIHSLYMGSDILQPIPLEKLSVKIKNSMHYVSSELGKVVFKSKDQHVRSDLHFENLTVQHGKVSELSSHTNLNKVATDRLIYALKHNGQQTFLCNTTVLRASCGNAATNLLNGNKMEDYVLLNSGPSKITGDVTFENISAKNAFVKDTINGVNVDEIVSRLNNKDISGRKIFRSLTAKSIRSTFESLLKKINGIIYSNSKNFSLFPHFSRTLYIKGNLSVSFLNDKRISHLFFNSIKNNEQDDIYGFKTLKSVVIKGNANILEGINNIPLQRLLTVNTDQKVDGDVTLSNSSHFADIFTDSWNGIDLSSAALVKFDSSPNNVIRGIKTFRENLAVSNIILKGGIQIDSFDPLAEISEIIFNTPNSSHEIHWFNNGMKIGGIIANDIEVDENDFPVLKDLDNVWLKTTEQNISYLETKHMTLYDVQVSNVDGVAIDDLVKVNGNSSINATVQFTGDVLTKTLNLRNGANANVSSEYWNPDVKVKLLGNITIEDPVLQGNLSIIGSIDVFEPGLVHTEKFQTVKGETAFEEIVLKDLNSTDVSLDILNKMNVTEYYERSVLSSKSMHISDKTFKELKGVEMKCDGTLNNISIESVVTANTVQKLTSSYKFQNSMYLKNADVKKFHDAIQLEQVVYTDGIGNISNKYFNGSVQASHLTANGSVSGVNITRLQLESFNKSLNNNVLKKMTFCGNVTANRIQVSGDKTVDGIDLENIVRLNESMTIEDFNANSIRADNVTVIGQISGCSLTEVLQNALSVRQDIQNITAKFHVSTLKIQGNLNVEYLNGASIQDWILYLNRTVISDLETDMIFYNLRTDNMYILNTVNDIDLDFLMRDHVGKNNTQEIRGKKYFRDINVENVAVDVLNSNKTCETDFVKLYRTSVSRSRESDTPVQSFIKLNGLESKYATVMGKLNDLKLPGDVVLSNTSDSVANVTISSFNASAGLHVSGMMNGFQLEDFLNERVRLDGSEDLSTELIFEDDVYITENCTVNGTINKINLNEIANVLHGQTISGASYFMEELWIKPRVVANGYINKQLLDQLQKSTLMTYRNESLKELVKFSTLDASSLICDTINGFDVLDLYNNTHSFVHYIEDKLHNLTYDIQTHQEILRNQRDSAEHPLSLYSWFKLHAILDFGLIERFLPIYEYGTYGPKYDLQVTQMVIWQKNNDTCMDTISLIAKVMKDGTFLITNRMEGKIFPFSLRVEKDDVVGFYVQVDHEKRCPIEKESHLAVTTLYASGEAEKKMIETPINATLLDVQLLEAQEIYLIFAYSNAGPSERIFVYQYDTVDGVWSSHQKFHFQDLTSLSIISVERDTDSIYDPPRAYFSVSGDDRNPGIAIYEWDFTSDEFFLQTNVSISLSSRSMWVDYDRTLYLLLAKGMDRIWKDNAWVNIFTEPLEVYTLEEELVLNHTVNVKGVDSLEVFGLADETFVLAASNHKETVYVLQFRGYNGFELIQEIPSTGVTETRVFTVDNHLYLALNSKTRESRVLKASIRGGRQGLE